MLLAGQTFQFDDFFSHGIEYKQSGGTVDWPFMLCTLHVM